MALERVSAARSSEPGEGCGAGWDAAGGCAGLAASLLPKSLALPNECTNAELYVSHPSREGGRARRPSSGNGTKTTS